MTLSFKTKINNVPTKFVDKIWQSLLRDGIEVNATEFSNKLTQVLPLIGNAKIGDFHPKRHTIREDKKNIWYAGRNIHFVINNRTKYRFQFGPLVKCIAVQKIEIIHTTEKWRQPWVKVDDKLLTGTEIDLLAKNDGFESTKLFFEYFNQTFAGKIIHWTNLKY